MNLSFRWLGVAGIELNLDGQILAIDPFFTRPSFKGFFRPVSTNKDLVAQIMPRCNWVLVTHSHWDHLMDVPEVLRISGASAYGSPNTVKLLRLLGVLEAQTHEVASGDEISLGAFKVNVIKGQHSSIPLARIFNGEIKVGAKPPQRLQDYRMDFPLGYLITVEGVQMLVCAGEPRPAEILFTVALEPVQYYEKIFSGVRPKAIVLIHWDNFTRPLSLPLKRFTRPGRISLTRLEKLIHSLSPQSKVIIPELFREYSIQDMLANQS